MDLSLKTGKVCPVIGYIDADQDEHPDGGGVEERYLGALAIVTSVVSGR